MPFAIGVHPHQAHQFADDPARAATVVREQFAATPSARAVGEIGLDYHYDFSPRDVQQEVFRAQVRLARELRGRSSFTRARPTRTRSRSCARRAAETVRGVLHCFTGTPALARAGLELGFYISLAGIMTFPKAAELRETVRRVPLDRLLVETDSPFLAPGAVSREAERAGACRAGRRGAGRRCTGCRGGEISWRAGRPRTSTRLFRP